MSTDPLQEKYIGWSPYHYTLSNPVKYVDPDGKQVGYPVPNTGYWTGVYGESVAQKSIKDNSTEIQIRIVCELLTYTDVNDAYVLSTAIVGESLTGEKGSYQTNGEPATTLDKVAGGIGLVLPFVSGSAVLKGVKKLGKILDIGGDATKNRVKLRKNVIQEIKDNAPKTSDGRFIDPNTQRPIDDPYDIGHIHGEEWRNRKKMHQERGSTRQEVIEMENDPNLYQIESRSSNRSGKYEKKD